MSNESKENKERLFIKVSAILLVIILILGIIYIVTSQNENQNPGFTMTYQDTSPKQAYDLLNKSINNTEYNLTIIDCRGLEGCSTCQFNRGHLPGAKLNQNYETLYNHTNDILVYSVDGTVGANFCENLTGNVYGAIYNLEGGFSAWDDAGYKIETGYS